MLKEVKKKAKKKSKETPKRNELNQQIKFPKGKYMDSIKKTLSRSDCDVSRLIAIDPASSYGKCAYAVFINNELVESGILSSRINDNTIRRLKSISVDLLYIANKYMAKTVVVELLRGGRTTPTQLIWSVGVIWGAVGNLTCIECPCNVWKAYANTVDDYVKDDIMDAKMIGLSILKIKELL